MRRASVGPSTQAGLSWSIVLNKREGYRRVFSQFDPQKRRGFGFVGSTIVYAHMQAVGMVNDHLLGCFR